MAGLNVRLDDRDAVSLGCFALGAVATLAQALTLWLVRAWLFPLWPLRVPPRPEWVSDLLVGLMTWLCSPRSAAVAWLANTSLFAASFLFVAWKLARDRGQGA